MPKAITPIHDTPLAAIKVALELSPYFAGLDRRYGLVDTIEASGAYHLLEEACQTIRDMPAELDHPAAMTGLRQAKSRAHFALAALDLSGNYNLDQVTSKLTQLADLSVQDALQLSAFKMGADLTGLSLFALGKMGAGELNYSSDIDMAAFFDAERFDGNEREPADAASRLVRDAMNLLEARTGDGYVFRTDLRLRPDPGSNPLAVSLHRADIYYESVGQNWERMVWIKGAWRRVIPKLERHFSI